MTAVQWKFVENHWENAAYEGIFAENVTSIVSAPYAEWNNFLKVITVKYVSGFKWIYWVEQERIVRPRGSTVKSFQLQGKL